MKQQPSKINTQAQLYSPSYLKQLCVQYDLTPSKKYGQNYLVSDAPIQKMIEAGELSKDDTVVEIGPGFGVLTLALAPLVQNVVAFEIEKKLQAYWDEMQKKYANVEIVWGNALKMLEHRDWRLRTSYKVLANLPYQITSHVLRTLLELEQKPERIVVMVQKEVAERIVAQPRSANSRQAGSMSLLALSVQYYGTPRIVTQVKKGNFWPSPKVDSAVISIEDIVPRDDADTFFRYARAGFANKRKQLWKNLSVGLGINGDVAKQALQDVLGNEKIRAEALSVEDWHALVDQLEAER